MPDGLYRVVGKKEGDFQRLTNFPAKIVKELVVTDGVDETREFEIEATVGGQTRRITIAATEFESMAWVLKKLATRRLYNPAMASGTTLESQFSNSQAMFRKTRSTPFLTLPTLPPQ